MDAALLHCFREFVSQKTSLNLREQDYEAFQKTILSRVKALKLTSTDEYYQLLNSDTSGSELERDELMVELTTGETYFSRDWTGPKNVDS